MLLWRSHDESRGQRLEIPMLLRDSIPISDGISNDFGSYSVRLDSFSNLMLNCWVQKGHNYVPRSQSFSPQKMEKSPGNEVVRLCVPHGQSQNAYVLVKVKIGVVLKQSYSRDVILFFYGDSAYDSVAYDFRSGKQDGMNHVVRHVVRS